ncbi:MAG: hypothetical protein H6851_03590 [Geminicoccaceae bacterium]|nr:hypothetical protein [Geminicoccaceae bacterium]MCB9942690.1 hypothetical protein [Geminicoccaceae bacterium]
MSSQRGMSQVFALLVLATLISGPALSQDSPVNIGRDSGLPVPRFVSLGADKIYMRTGPGKEFPIKWVYSKRGLPMEVIEESDDWREVKDPDNETGWIHKSLLSGKRYLMIANNIADLRRTPSDEAMVVARIEPRVVVEMLNCQPVWCLVDVGDRRGWLSRRDVFGLLKDELP